jgi:hypothetical protein
MVWGLISGKGPEKLVWLNENPKDNMNTDAYIEILEEHVLEIDDFAVGDAIF